MTAWEAVGACIAAAILLLLAATKGWDRWHKPRTDRRFQRTARQAARTTGELTPDEAQTFDRIVAAEFPKRIPHQTRRTEENQ
ncbi:MULTISPECIES: hypothetical protein [unclassified Streptomyces]|uniref:hypothetical protein n=1 Tax=unclassified Streptomyces TaxID=2593676 RepID=UPI0033294AD5